MLRKNPAPHVRFPDYSMNNSKNFRSQAAYGIPDRASWHTSRRISRRVLPQRPDLDEATCSVSADPAHSVS